MQKLAGEVDRVTPAEDKFFERFPNRRHRVRLASDAEIAHHEILEGEPMWMPPGRRIFAVVRNIAPGVRLRIYIRGLEGSEIDLDEATARAIVEASATSKTWEIEAELRKVAEARA
jgi:hypothetical protein